MYCSKSDDRVGSSALYDKPYFIESSARLTREEEIEVFHKLETARRQLAAAGSMAPADPAEIRSWEKVVERLEERVISANQGLVGSLVATYLHYGLTKSDLMAEANVGLLKALRNFDHRRGVRFSTHAMLWIKQACTRALSKQARIIRIPENKLDAMRKLKRTMNELARRFNEVPDTGELAAATGLTVETVNQLLLLECSFVPLDAPVGGEETDTKSYGETIKDEAVICPDVALERAEDHRLLDDACAALEPRERIVVEAAFGMEGSKHRDIESLAVQFGVCRQRISQIKDEALAKIRKFVSARQNATHKVPPLRPHGGGRAGQPGGKRPAAPRNGTPLLMRKTNNPNHHISLNNGTYFYALTIFFPDGRKKRVRRSLKTKDVEVARIRRNEIIDGLRRGGMQVECER